MSIGRLGPSKVHFVVAWDVTIVEEDVFLGLTSVCGVHDAGMTVVGRFTRALFLTKEQNAKIPDQLTVGGYP